MMCQRPTVQVYEHYTAEDFAVWKILFNRQMQYLSGPASASYLNAVKDIGFNQDYIPDFKDMNQTLAQATGWQIIATPGLVPEAIFFEMLASKTFPASCWLRNMDALDYLEEPDMFHDVFGHVPLLMHAGYALFMERFGKAVLPWLDNKHAVALFSSIYWYTVEFGFLKENGVPKIFGAGILSSTAETSHALEPATKKLPFDLETVLNTPYQTDQLQETYFVADSFAQMEHCINLLGLRLQEFSLKQGSSYLAESHFVM
jgi:phenylalanine-4-hydroxylase